METSDRAFHKFYWDENLALPVILAEKDKDNNNVASYGYEQAFPLFMRTNFGNPAGKSLPSNEYYLYDIAGSVIMITDENGNILNEFEYDEFGVIISGEKSEHNKCHYTGQMFDSESNLLYMRQRYYDPTLGRFIQPEISYDYPVNPYEYCESNPISRIDINGEQAEAVVTAPWWASIFGGGSAAGGGAAVGGGVIIGPVGRGIILVTSIVVIIGGTVYFARRERYKDTEWEDKNKWGEAQKEADRIRNKDKSKRTKEEKRFLDRVKRHEKSIKERHSSECK